MQATASTSRSSWGRWRRCRCWRRSAARAPVAVQDGDRGGLALAPAEGPEEDSPSPSAGSRAWRRCFSRRRVPLPAAAPPSSPILSFCSKLGEGFFLGGHGGGARTREGGGTIVSGDGERELRGRLVSVQAHRAKELARQIVGGRFRRLSLARALAQM